MDVINRKVLEGVGTTQICQDHGDMTLGELNNHRASGHAGKALTAMVLDAHHGPLSDFAQYAIASKLHRVARLDGLLTRVMAEMDSQKIGELDPKLVKEAVSLLTTASKEMGEWKPDGGEKAEATAQLAQSIVIHAAVQAGKMAQRVIDVAAVSTLDSTKSSDEDTTE